MKNLFSNLLVGCLSLSVLTQSSFADGERKKVRGTFHRYILERTDGKEGIEDVLEEMEPYSRRHTGRRFKLEGHGNLPPESVVEIDGTVYGSTLRSSRVSSQSVVAAAPLSGPLTGTRSVAVLLVNLNNVVTGCTVPQVQANSFGPAGTISINSGFLETSFNNFGITGDVFGPYTLSSISSTSPCNDTAWQGLADQLAAADGVNLNNYQHVLYLFPNNNTCTASYSGKSTFGGRVADSFTCNKPITAMHELSHNLGIMHESTDGTGAYPASEYTYPPSDIMGNQWGIIGAWLTGPALAHFNTPHMEQFGWISQPAVTTPGTYVITPSEYPNPMYVKVKIPGQTSYYYAGYRAPIGTDAMLDSTFLNKVIIYKYADGTRTYLQKVLNDGLSYTGVGGISFTQVSHDANSATITVNLDVTPPSVPSNLNAVRNAKRVTLSWGASTDPAGGSGGVTYRITRTNSLGVVVTYTTSSTSYVNSNVPSQSYTYTVAAIDLAGNVSAESNVKSVVVP